MPPHVTDGIIPICGNLATMNTTLSADQWAGRRPSAFNYSPTWAPAWSRQVSTSWKGYRRSTLGLTPAAQMHPNHIRSWDQHSSAHENLTAFETSVCACMGRHSLHLPQSGQAMRAERKGSCLRSFTFTHGHFVKTALQEHCSDFSGSPQLSFGWPRQSAHVFWAAPGHPEPSSLTLRAGFVVAAVALSFIIFSTS